MCGWSEIGLSEMVALDPPLSEIVSVAAGGIGETALTVRMPNGICTVTDTKGVHCTVTIIPSHDVIGETANIGTASPVSGGWLSSFRVAEIPARAFGSGRPSAATFALSPAPIPDTKKVKIWPGATLIGIGAE
jgi:hypothetical protein